MIIENISCSIPRKNFFAGSNPLPPDHKSDAHPTELWLLWNTIFRDDNSSPKHTENPLYTDTRYNDKIRYNENLSVTKPLLKR